MIEITVSRKNSIVVNSPVLFAAGFAGYDGAAYRNLLALDQFGALVTSPLTLAPRQPAHGTRVVSLPSGFLLHTGLPNAGLRRTLQDYSLRWKRSVLPIIAHLVADDPREMEQMITQLEQNGLVSGVEIGLNDQITMREARDLILAAKYNADLPILVRLPLYNALLLSEVAQQCEADALVATSPPRGTERDPKAGRLIGGRVYGAWLKSLVLRLVGRIVQFSDIPVIAVGGIHTPEDARDYIIAGARAVQLDSIVWRDPQMAEKIARDLGGTELTRTSGAFLDEWDTRSGSVRPSNPPPDILPELPNEDEITRDADSPDWED